MPKYSVIYTANFEIEARDQTDAMFKAKEKLLGEYNIKYRSTKHFYDTPRGEDLEVKEIREE